MKGTVRELLVDLDLCEKEDDINHKRAWLQYRHWLEDSPNPIRALSLLVLPHILVENQLRAFACVIDEFRWASWQDDAQIKRLGGWVLERPFDNTLQTV